MKTIIVVALSFCLMVGGLFIYNNYVYRQIANLFIEDVFHNGERVNILLGSSSIKRIDADKYFPCKNWINRGIGGANITDVVRYFRISNVKKRIETVVIYMGENDISNGFKVSDVFNEYTSFVDYIVKFNPKVKIFIIPVKLSPSRYAYFNDFIDINKSLDSFYIHKENVVYLSGSEIYNDNGKFESDGVHLTQSGYDKFTQGASLICPPR